MLQNEDQENLGLTGYGPEVSIYRSLLLNTSIHQQIDSKWQITDGWKPGKYKLSVRVTHLGAGPTTTLSVTSKLCEFVIRQKATTD